MFKFNHEAENLPRALSISEETEHKVEEMVFYSAASNHLLGKELFDNENDRPKALTTITGDLEKALGLTATDEERFYMLLRFYNIHDLTLECISKYRAIMEAETPAQQKKAAMFIQLLNMKLEEALEERDKKIDNNFISPISILNRIRLVKESRYDFNRYLNLVNQNKSKLNTFNPELFYESETN
jgi:hypothetical protein